MALLNLSTIIFFKELRTTKIPQLASVCLEFTSYINIIKSNFLMFFKYTLRDEPH